MAKRRQVMLLGGVAVGWVLLGCTIVVDTSGYDVGAADGGIDGGDGGPRIDADTPLEAESSQLVDAETTGSSAFFFGGRLTRTVTTASDRTKWTLATWFKKTGGADWQGILGATGTVAQITPTSTIVFWQEGIKEVVESTQPISIGVWHHLVFAVDTGLAPPNNVRTYVDGVELTTFQRDRRSQLQNGYLTDVNRAVVHRIGDDGANEPFFGNLWDLYLIDGQQLSAASFVVSTAGGCKPTVYTGTYGPNGFHLLGAGLTISSLGTDTSGNKNDFTVVGSVEVRADHP